MHLSFIFSAFVLIFIATSMKTGRPAKAYYQANGLKFRAVTDQPLFYLALVALVLGVILFLAGFLGEMIARSSEGRNNYQIKERA